MKLYISQELGSIYWIENNDLFYAPLSAKSGLIDTDNDGGLVDFAFLDNDTDYSEQEEQNIAEQVKAIKTLLTK